MAPFSNEFRNDTVVTVPMESPSFSASHYTPACSVLNTPSPLYHPVSPPDTSSMPPLDLGQSYSNFDSYISPHGPYECRTVIYVPVTTTLLGGSAATESLVAYDTLPVNVARSKVQGLHTNDLGSLTNALQNEPESKTTRADSYGRRQHEPVIQRQRHIQGPHWADAQDHDESQSSHAQVDVVKPSGGSAQECTTLMLRNIPNRYTRTQLMKHLNQSYAGEFDFVYLPMDFKHKCNIGYCFINFRTLQACDRFRKQFHGVRVCKCLPGGHMSKKVAEVSLARVHGQEENINRLINSTFIQELRNHPEYLPIILDAHGSEVPFPFEHVPVSEA